MFVAGRPHDLAANVLACYVVMDGHPSPQDTNMWHAYDSTGGIENYEAFEFPGI